MYVPQSKKNSSIQRERDKTADFKIVKNRRFVKNKNRRFVNT